MNPEIKTLFNEYQQVTDDKLVVAVLVLADVLKTPTPAPIIVEPEPCHSYTVKEAAARMGVSSKSVYQMILAGKLHSYRVGRAIRIPVEEIERFEANCHATPMLAVSSTNRHGVL